MEDSMRVGARCTFYVKEAGSNDRIKKIRANLKQLIYRPQIINYFGEISTVITGTVMLNCVESEKTKEAAMSIPLDWIQMAESLASILSTQNCRIPFDILNLINSFM